MNKRILTSIEQDDSDLRRTFEETRALLITTLNQAFLEDDLTLSASYNLSHKTISEIGGRIIEEYISESLEKQLRGNNTLKLVSTASRSLGDFVLESKTSKHFKFYFDVKAQHISIRDKTEQHYKKFNIKAKKPGESHPNLIAFHKARDFFSDSMRHNEDIAFLMIHYDPILRGREVVFNLNKLTESSVFLLRDISDVNLSYGNLGKGQLQLKRIKDLQMQVRNRNEFVALIDKLANASRKSRASKSN